MFKSINRDVLILSPKQPLIDWVNYIFPNDKLDCPKLMGHDEADLFLIPEFYHYDDAVEFLKENFIVFFEQELFEWTTDETLWPKNLTWELFKEWFHYSIQSVIMDTLEEDIEKNDF